MFVALSSVLLISLAGITLLELPHGSSLLLWTEQLGLFWLVSTKWSSVRTLSFLWNLTPLPYYKKVAKQFRVYYKHAIKHFLKRLLRKQNIFWSVLKTTCGVSGPRGKGLFEQVYPPSLLSCGGFFPPAFPSYPNYLFQNARSLLKYYFRRVIYSSGDHPCQGYRRSLYLKNVKWHRQLKSVLILRMF